tara:strand:- start:435 stop:2225 length:1791 start_codon:yes stop_codon:yes gene_type:complete
MPVTSNSNNNYEVEIIESTDISGLISQPPPVPSFLQTAQNGQEFIEWKITPTTIGYPLIASNMRLKGNPPIPGNYYWEEKPWAVWRPGNMSGTYTGPNPNIQPQADECTPPVTPHNLTPTQTPLPMITQGPQWCSGTSCPGNGYGPWSPNHSINQACQVVEFIHPLTNYPNLGIGSPNVEGIYSELTIMVEVYEDDNGNLVNDNLTPTNNFLSGNWPAMPTTYMWIQWDAINHAPITLNPYPKYLKCFSFITYNANLLNYQAPQVLDLLFDLDEVPPVSGCTDPGALNYNANAVVDDGSCSYLNQQSYQIQLSFDLSQGYSPPGVPGVIPPGPYTNGAPYSFTVPYPQNQTFLYTTVDWDVTQGVDQNLRFNNGALTETVMLSNYYNPGDQVSELVEIYVYPYTDQSGGGPVIYDFPGPGGPSAMFNLPDPTGSFGAFTYADYIQRMYSGWGNTKNNLTAASLRIQLGLSGWLTPDYEDPAVLPGPIALSGWINGPDITGLQPSQTVDFSQNGALPPEVSGISAMEEINPVSGNPARDYFPNKVKVRVQLDFTAPSPQQGYTGPNPWSNSNLLFTIPVSLIHITENQGDLNWTAPI